jgi:hypothetical protein
MGVCERDWQTVKLHYGSPEEINTVEAVFKKNQYL